MAYGGQKIARPEKRVVSVAQRVEDANGCLSFRLPQKASVECLYIVHSGQKRSVQAVVLITGNRKRGKVVTKTQSTIENGGSKMEDENKIELERDTLTGEYFQFSASV